MADQNAHGSFAEAIVLPYSIVTKDRKHSGHNRSPVKEETRKKLEHDIFTDIYTNYSVEASTCSNTKGDRVDTKRFDNTNMKCMCSISTPNRCDGDGVQDHLSSYFDKEQMISEKYCDRLPEERQKLKCSLYFKNLDREDVLLHGNLFILINRLKSKELSEENPCLKKVLLEFGCQSLSYYQVCKRTLSINILNEEFKFSHYLSHDLTSYYMLRLSISGACRVSFLYLYMLNIPDGCFVISY
jgi:hypothetical protein